MRREKEAKLSGPGLEVAQKAFLVVDDHLLMVRHGVSDRLNPHRWEVPGGRMIAGEDLDKAIRREVLEEVSIDIEPGPAFAAWSWEIPPASEYATSVRVVAVARLCRSFNPEPNLPTNPNWDHLDGFAWVPIDEVLSMDLIPNALDAFKQFTLIAGASVYADWVD